MSFKVVEIFTSINGESRKAGELAVFVRFAGCNLNCSYCDTRWANQPDTRYIEMSADEIYTHIKKTGVKNVTLTGGEPLLQPDILELIQLISQDAELSAEIETNGSVSIEKYMDIPGRPSMTLDYKSPSSGMERLMELSNYELVTDKDTVKFVCGSHADLDKARTIIEKYSLASRCQVYLSPIYGLIEPADMVEYMKEHLMNNVRLQLQLHKFIWDPSAKGV